MEGIEMYDGEIIISRSHETFKKKKNKQHPTVGPPKRLNTSRVLVVDDDFAIKVLVTAMLEVNNCLVDRAESGSEALGCLSTKSYDLVLTDFYMPGKDGYQLAREIRSRWPETKIVIMTGSNQYDMRSMADDRHVDALLFKPFGLEEINRLLDRFDSQ